MTDPLLTSRHPDDRWAPAGPTHLRDDVGRLLDNLGRAVHGKDDVLRLVVVSLLAEGHLLIEDVPGTGKTTIARALAASIAGEWRRIQFTPDLLPSDVTGSLIFNKHDGSLTFREGAVFANVVVADEINRASPKTQSALLEVMEERRVTVDFEPHPVPRPFLVVATQNPVEMDGTYRLPEAQLDRFLMRVSVGYPDLASEVAILSAHEDDTGVDTLSPVTDTERLGHLVRAVSRVEKRAVVQYVAEMAAATRPSPDPRQRSELRLGVSTRGSKALLRAAQALAFVSGRDHVEPEDVIALAVPVLAHRVILDPEAAMSGRKAEDVVADVVRAVPVPRVTG